jgi:hypothetical protein
MSNNNDGLREENEVTSIANTSKNLKLMSLSASDPKAALRDSSSSGSPLQSPSLSSSVKATTAIDQNGPMASAASRPSSSDASHPSSEEAKGGSGTGLFADVADRAKFEDPELLLQAAENQEDDQDARVSIEYCCLFAN